MHREGRQLTHIVVPRGDSQLGTGDEVVLLVTSETEDEVRKLLVAP